MAMHEGGSSVLEKILGKRIQAFRQRAGLTQQQLCNKANISYSTLTKIERGAIKAPSIFTVSAISKALGCNLDELIGNDQENDPSRHLKKSRNGISFIYFDVNGCLVRFYQRAFIKIAEEFQVSTDLVETAFWHFNDDACRGTLSIAEFNKKLAEKIGINNIEWQSYYLEAAEAVPETRELIKSIFNNYKVGLLTNIMPGLLTSLRRLGRLPNLPYDAIVDSSEVGYVKPEQKIYEIAKERAGLSSSEILLIDDTRANLVAAERLGWHVLWFDYANPSSSVERIKDILI